MSDEIPLGKASEYTDQYDPDLLHAIPRAEARQRLGLGEDLPFQGVDIWNAYELSWLNSKGKPQVAVAEFRVRADSPAIVESKSLKLYLYSLNGTRFASEEEVAETIRGDLGRITGSPVTLRLAQPGDHARFVSRDLPGICIDEQDLAMEEYQVNPEFLAVDEERGRVTENLHSHLLRSNCPITAQPDWASLVISYRGPAIDHAGLLRYVVSFRNHDDFHEHCVERIFMDLKQRCEPEHLTVYACYTRRGGIDISPFRSDFQDPPEFRRTWRQ